MIKKVKQIEIQEESYSEDINAVAELAESQTALVDYLPKSKAPYKMNTLIPRNMAFEVQKSLNTITRIHGNIDHYVRNHLKYNTTENLWNALAAEQVDALGLYLHQFDKEQGIIIADQTGIGKGRQAAAVIRHAVMQGYLPIFMTKSPNLFTDMYRDLLAIDFGSINPFIINTTSNARIKDAYGNVVFSPLNAKEQEELLGEYAEYATDSPESIAYHKDLNKDLPDITEVPFISIFETLDRMPIGYDMIFCTYSQIQSANPYKRRWIEKLVENGFEGSKIHKKVVFILDESHMAGGYDSIIGRWMRKVLPNAKACCYLSATFAKYPEVMPLYGKKTAILETGLSDSVFVYSMKRGGLALQEIVASNLSESGQLIRRQRSSEGIKIDYKVLDKEPIRSKNRESVNRIISLMNEIVEFQESFVFPVLKEIEADIFEKGGETRKKPRGFGVKQSPYFSRVFNVIDQMLFALKVPEVAKETLTKLKDDKKVVIAFKSTMGTFMKDMKLSSGDIIPSFQLDFTRSLIKGLDSVFFYNMTSIDNKKTRERIPLEMLSSLGIEIYKDIKKRMNLESSGLSISPIDELINLIQSERKPTHLGGHSNTHFTVAEVTGRSQRFDMSDKNFATVQAYRNNTEKAFREFNSGIIDVMLINQSGSTGASAHSSKEFEDQRQRAMLIHQFELDIYIEVQKRGRINRTGQVNLPEYLYMTSDIPMERRLMAMLKGKLKSLDANTTGSQNTNEDTLESPDFFNKYGDKVAWQWINDNADKMPVLGYPTYHKEKDKEGKTIYVRNETRENAIRQLTGRAGLLQVEQQEKLFNEMVASYDHQIKLEKQNGTYDLETEFLPLDAAIKKRFLFDKGNGGTTPFGKDSILDFTIVNNIKRPYTIKEIEQKIEARLDGETPLQVRQKLEEEIAAEYPKLIESRRVKRYEVIEKLTKELDEFPEVGSGVDEAENDKIQNDLENLEILIQKKTTELATYIKGLERVQFVISKVIGQWDIGAVVKVPFIGASFEPSWGIFLGVTIGRSSSNPYTYSNIMLQFAVTDSRKLVNYSLQPAEQAYISQIWSESKDLLEEEQLEAKLQWNEYIKQASQKREPRYIITENILKASEYIGTVNKLIKYNTQDGAIKNGILLNREFNKEAENKGALMPISSAYSYILELKNEEFIEDHRVFVRFKRISTDFFEVYMSKKNMYKASIDPKLLILLYREANQSIDELPNFIQVAGEMKGALHYNSLEAFLKQLDTYQLRFLGKQQEIKDWELENEQDWKQRSTTGTGSFKYALGRSYGQGSNPTTGFEDYVEPTDQYPNGYVVYNRALSDKEKYNFSLQPIFESLNIPFEAWKNVITQTSLKSDYNQVILKARKLKLHEAITLLGQFIIENLHEEGNAEFVFGAHTISELGRIFYEDSIAEISEIEALISQLQIALQK